MNDATVTFGYDGKALNAGLKDAESRLKKSVSKMESAASGLAKIMTGGGIYFAGKAAADTVMNMDRLTRGMTTLEGSASAAAERMNSLREAAKLPGLEFEQAVKGDIRLRSVGISAELSREALIQMGNALSLAGGTSADLDGVVLALTQIVSKGKVSAEEINQIAERVPQVRAVMKDMFGTADTEVLQKMNIDAETFISTLVQGFVKLARAQAGLDEQMNNFRTSVNAATNAFAEGFVKQGIAGASSFGEALDRNNESIRNFGAISSSIFGGAVDLISDAGKGIGQLVWELDKYVKALEQGKTVEQYRAEYQAILLFNQELKDRAMLQQQYEEFLKKPKPKSPLEQKDSTAAPIIPGGSKKTNTDAQKVMRAQEQFIAAQNKAAMEQMNTAQKILDVKKRIASQEAMIAAASTLEGDSGKIMQIEAQTKMIELQRELNALIKEQASEADKVRQGMEAERESFIMREAAKKSLAEEIMLLEAKANGQTELVKRMERELQIREKAKQIEAQTGVDPARARIAAQKIVSLEEKANTQNQTTERGSPGMKKRMMGGGLNEFYQNQIRDGTQATAIGANSISGRGATPVGGGSKVVRPSRMIGGGGGGGLSDRAAIKVGNLDLKNAGDKKTAKDDLASRIDKTNELLSKLF